MSTLSRKRSLSAEPATTNLDFGISQFIQSPLSAVPVFKDYPMDVSEGEDDDSANGEECRRVLTLNPPASFCASVASSTPTECSTALTTATRTSSLASMLSVTPPPNSLESPCNSKANLGTYSNKPYYDGRAGSGAKFSVVDFPFTRNEDYYRDRATSGPQYRPRGRGGSGVQHTAEHIPIRPTLATTTYTAAHNSQQPNQNFRQQKIIQKGSPPTTQKSYSPTRRHVSKPMNAGHVKGQQSPPLTMNTMGSVGAGFCPPISLVPAIGMNLNMMAFPPFQGLPFGLPFFAIPLPAEATNLPHCGGDGMMGQQNANTQNQGWSQAASFFSVGASCGQQLASNNNNLNANVCPLPSPPLQQHQPYSTDYSTQPLQQVQSRPVGVCEAATTQHTQQTAATPVALGASIHKYDAHQQGKCCEVNTRQSEIDDAEPHSPAASTASTSQTRIRFVHPSTWRHEPYAAPRPVPNPIPIADDGTLTGTLRPVDVDPSLASATFSTSLQGEPVVELVPDDGRHKQHKWVEINVNEPHEDLRKRRYRFSGTLPCNHRVFAKRLRYRRGWTYFMCVTCGFKWGESGAR